jgi:hypothetical protein
MRNFGALGYTGIRRSILAEAALHNYESPIYLQHDVGYPYSTYGAPGTTVADWFQSPQAAAMNKASGPGTAFVASGSPAANKYDARASGFTAAGNVLSSLVTGIFGARAAQAGAGGQTVVYQEPAGPNWGLILGGVAVTGVLVTGLVLALRK